MPLKTLGPIGPRAVKERVKYRMPANQGMGHNSEGSVVGVVR
jgi:hypothetical protein